MMIPRLLAFSLALAGLTAAGELFTAPFGEGGTWNLYQCVSRPVTWNDAMRLAGEMKAPSGDTDLTGHLATFSSLAENLFMRQVSDRQSAWCGLTDDERFGGREAGAHPRDGWKWITGEPLTFSNWKPGEPDDWSDAGEDGVIVERHGRWTDAGIGIGGQAANTAYFLVEWETRSPRPVEGAIPLAAAWPANIGIPPLVKGRWSVRWASGMAMIRERHYGSPRSIPQAAALFTTQPPASSGQPKLLQSQGTAQSRLPWLWTATPDSNRQGWLPSNDEELSNFPGIPTSNRFIAAVVGEIQVETAGTYTMAVTAEDAFALRVGGLKWKAAHGDGYIDPLDPLTITQPYGTFSSKALGVIDLPAGNHRIEAMWMTETTGSEFHVLSAPGIHLTEGSTTDWRPLGHVRAEVLVPMLGVTEEGWTIDASLPRKRPIGAPALGLQEALVEMELDLDRISASGLPSINFADAPETNPTHYPSAAAFPNQKERPQSGDWPLRARAKLVVPATGFYHIGLHAAGQAALRIKGGELSGASQTAQGRKDLHLRSDSFDFNGQSDTNSDPKIVTKWRLPQGECEIEVFYIKHLGPASLAIFGCATGPYPPGLLTAGGAKLADDLPGLPHSSN
jgi:hypothetical protein